ncbi:MAG: hypothetical protein B6D37_01050 [Sphingobacteriales bacterium UTBCD1]|jgi:transcriptional regulator NrdR family protein|nr:MAG: hypothetical protein B6D37_01050 [Sphingobacteriales bacterium UTBCD1]
MIFSLATKAQRHKAAQRQLSEPWCPGAFVAKVILATKAQRHEVAQRRFSSIFRSFSLSLEKKYETV